MERTFLKRLQHPSTVLFISVTVLFSMAISWQWQSGGIYSRIKSNYRPKLNSMTSNINMTYFVPCGTLNSTINVSRYSSTNARLQLTLSNETDKDYSNIQHDKLNMLAETALSDSNTSGFTRNHTICMWNAPQWLHNGVLHNVDMQHCPDKNCEVVFNKQLFQLSSAVVFATVNSGMGFKPPVSPEKRNVDQAWIFFELESPVHNRPNDYKSPHWHDVMNWSWTYRTDADIYNPYGVLQPRFRPPEKNYSEIFRQKSKMAAWAVSHCFTSSKREIYVQMLQNFTTVDIYGDCGKKDPGNIATMLDKDYKFYLAFENSLCQDYVTEKFFNNIQRDIITVVRGGADYRKLFPNGGHLNTADFLSVKQLAEFMTKLGNDENEYIKYLEVKDMYTVKRNTVFNAFCDICHKLNNLDRYRRTYSDMVPWFGTCDSPHDLT